MFSSKTSCFLWQVAIPHIAAFGPQNVEISFISIFFRPLPGKRTTQKQGCLHYTRIAVQFARFTFLGDNVADLSRVSTPALIIHCHPDVIVPVQVGEFVHKKIDASKYVFLNTSGHCPHLTAPEQVIHGIQSFLKITNEHTGLCRRRRRSLPTCTF